jgi:hypothetical protein
MFVRWKKGPINSSGPIRDDEIDMFKIYLEFLVRVSDYLIQQNEPL